MNAGTETGDLAARHWDDWQVAHSRTQPRFTDWGDHPTILKLVFGQVFGNPDTDFLQHLARTYPEFAHGHALSLCCGDGAFERHLVAQGVFGSITGIDVSPARVTAALQQRAGFESRLDFEVGDVNAGQFGQRRFDVVFAKAALHHVENLEALVHGIRAALRPGGCLVTIDFFGPTRFQWTDAQLAVANAFLAGVPRPLLRKQDGGLHDRMTRPEIDDMIRLDPSEAVRSGELYELLKANFTLVEDLALGGTLLNLVFYGDVVNNFDPDNEGHNQIIREAFALERRLIDEGALGSDFRLIVARPLSSGLAP